METIEEQELQNEITRLKALIPKWKDVNNPPTEGGRYWCLVRDANDLGTSYYQWNCSYNPEGAWEGKWHSNALRKNVVCWTELLDCEKEKYAIEYPISVANILDSVIRINS